MRLRSTSLILAFGLLVASPAAFCYELSIFLPEAESAASNSKEEALYADGTRAINESRWADAESLFDQVIAQHGTRADGGMYWKAYAENKQGQSAKALTTCGQLRQSYPSSNWLDECGALEIEIRGSNGQAVLPQSEQDQDLKLLALNSLMQHDESRALPLVQQILNGSGSPKLKERALFVLAQSQSKQAQDLLGQIAQGKTDPALQVRAIQMIAVTHGPQSANTLGNIYASSNDERVKKAVLQAYLISGDREKLAQAARGESNPALQKTAVQELGAMGATSDLLAIYRSTGSAEVKNAIISSLVASGEKGTDALKTIASSEQDPDLRRKAVRNLGITDGAANGPFLADIYRKSSDSETKKAAAQGLFLSGDAHDLVALAKEEKDPAMKKYLVQQLSLMHSPEAKDYMLEILK